MEVIAGIIELKPDSMDRVEEWANTINQRIEETLQRLKMRGF